MTATELRCPICGESSAPDARFCEACGGLLDGAPATATAATASGRACVDCEAPSAQIGADGYCQVCGRKQPAVHDHEELVQAGVVAVTDRGVTHHRNEAAFACAVAPGVVVVMVCDGVSSTADSDRAAIDAAAAGRDFALAQLVAGASPLDAARGAIGPAQLAAAAIPRTTGEVASCTAVFFAARAESGDTIARSWQCAVAWLGDSRAYRWRDGTVEQLTDDHSWATEQIHAGMSSRDAFADPRCHSITRWLGADAVDTEPSVRTFDAAPGDRVLVVSDGLWNYAGDTPAMTKLLAERGTGDTIESARALVDFANEQGGHDNITVAVATF
jgi:serine/threonine protein phosphatase PrpC